MGLQSTYSMEIYFGNLWDISNHFHITIKWLVKNLEFVSFTWKCKGCILENGPIRGHSWPFMGRPCCIFTKELWPEGVRPSAFRETLIKRGKRALGFNSKYSSKKKQTASCRRQLGPKNNWKLSLWYFLICSSGFPGWEHVVPKLLHILSNVVWLGRGYSTSNLKPHKEELDFVDVHSPIQKGP